jgi:hypothetical protein
VGLVACANQAAPPGGLQDRRPPVVVRTEPESFATMTDPEGRVRFFFDERISENIGDGGLESAVTVSPRTGDVRVSRSGNAISVELEGGFRPGLVYRVTLQPVVADLFSNRMTEPFEVVFSTGGDPDATATLAGEVWDRLSGQGVNGARVQAVGRDSLVNVAQADRRGVFAFRYLLPGDFVVTAFQDNDRNGELGDREPQGSVSASLVAGDTAVVEIPILAPDTTPAVPGAARALDSVTIVVEFDDFLDPTSSADQIGVRLTREDGDAPLVTRLMHEREYEEYVDQVADSFARLDSIDAAAARAAAPPPDSTADTLAVAGAPTADSTAPAPPSAPAPPRRATPPRLTGSTGNRSQTGRIRPSRRLVGLLDGPLVQEVEYRLRVSSVVNINGLGDGGGEVTLTYEPPPPPPAADSTQAEPATPADSLAAPDSTGVRP